MMVAVATMDTNSTGDIELEAPLARAIALLSDPSKGLPDPVFNFVLKVTAVPNVDLLVADDRGRRLLTWRVDEYGAGWHVPGGIIRWGESIQNRINEVARLELGSTVTTTRQPALITQFISVRGTFISMLYNCTLTSEVTDPSVRFSQDTTHPSQGQLHWFDGIPEMLYPAHDVYRHLLHPRSS